ncbi:NAD-dependent epimerase/dehydratase family protein [Rubellimicrobium roseum]|uniref:NAD-dependent epimerase/dehydratase family protein n=1 Tax=Rubellimicrobium roseum TaxID=687525 RepID=A0A5C4NF68_9RHOB|nr:NAD-dependent epimerase/dehydratase family protein [Rubellimicrobium roseum]TNC70315.1 NAD-dependent epimerase/dehydratase family protein [Rubellimicrobium roseum]
MPEPVPPGALVVLTGASGFIAKHIARRLLEDGHAVRATLRSPSREAEVRAAVLPGLPPEAEGRLTFATADLTADAGWAQAMEGAQALLHTASPFPLNQPRDPEVLIRPAVEGTRRALTAAADAGVRRVVLTSSVAAIVNPGSREMRDESTWLDLEAPGVTPYYASKALAERAAWDLARDRGLRLTAINPSVVLGPLLDRQSGTSVALVQRLLRARDPLVPRLNFAAVDVRDVAAMHVRALALPATEGERVIASAGLLPMPEMARILKRAYPDRRIPTREAPDWLIRALALALPDMRTAASFLGGRDLVSNAKARRLFGMDFIPPEEALLASARSLIEQGLA